MNKKKRIREKPLQWEEKWKKQLPKIVIQIQMVRDEFDLSKKWLNKKIPFDFNVFLILIIAYLVFGFYFFFSAYFYYFKKTKILSLFTFSIATLNILFSYLLNFILVLNRSRTIGLGSIAKILSAPSFAAINE